jgi:hypothetical protein
VVALGKFKGKLGKELPSKFDRSYGGLVPASAIHKALSNDFNNPTCSSSENCKPSFLEEIKSV